MPNLCEKFRHIAALGIVVTSIWTPLASAECPLALRSYEDVEGRGFVLEFDPPPADRPTGQVAMATILHSARGRLFEAAVFVQQDDSYLVSRAGEKHHSIYFFTNALQSTSAAAGSQLMFIDGLGRADRTTADLPGSREHPLGDPLWRLVGCKE